MSNGAIMALTTLQFGLSPRIIADLHAVFAQYPHIQQVRLFGSRATTHYHPAADIDLVVDAPDMPNHEWSALWNAIDELPLAFMIDLVHYDTITNAAFRAQIDATAVPFWSQKTGSALR
jgi:predicted nucleotidyltransferase